MKKIITAMFILFFTILFVNAQEYISLSPGDKIVMKVGAVVKDNIRNIVVNNKQHTIELVLCDSYSKYCAFRVDGNPTGRMYSPMDFPDKQTFYKLDDPYSMNIIGIQFDYCDNQTFCDASSFYTIVNIMVKGPSQSCGNNICDFGETCNSCAQDCACSSGYLCQSDKCVEKVICGDNKCSSGETCDLDNCCNGVNYNLNIERNNCGSCNNVCFINQDCISGICTNLTEYCGDGICNLNENCGTCIKDCACTNNTRCESNKCTTYCGNGICEIGEEGNCKLDCKWCGDSKCNVNETYETCPTDCQKPVVCGDNICDNNENCCIDCGCNSGFNCINNSCMSIYQCISNSDCNANETCVNNKCALIQTIQENASFSNQSSTIPIVKNVTTNATAQSLTNENKSVFQTIIDWFLSLFG